MNWANNLNSLNSPNSLNSCKMEKQTFTVTELNNRIKNLLDRDPFLADVCVRGELSNYKIYPSGHHYFTLKDS